MGVCTSDNCVTGVCEHNDRLILSGEEESGSWLPFVLPDKCYPEQEQVCQSDVCIKPVWGCPDFRRRDFQVKVPASNSNVPAT